MTDTPNPAATTGQPVVAVKGAKVTIGVPLIIALVLIAGVWVGGAVWSFAEQTAYAAFKHFEIPQLLPLVIDGLAIAMAAVAWAASLDGRAAVLARLGTAIAVFGSAGSNAAWAWERSTGDTGTIALAVAVPVAANVAFEVLLSEIRKQVQRWRGLPAPAAVPMPRLVRLLLAPWSTYFQWRRLVLQATDPRVAFNLTPTVAEGHHRAGAVAVLRRTPPTHPPHPVRALRLVPLTPVTNAVTAPAAAVTATAIVADIDRPAVTAEPVTAPDTDGRRVTAPLSVVPDVDTDTGDRPVSAAADTDDRSVTAAVTELAATNGRKVSGQMTGAGAVRLRPFGRPEVSAKVAKLADKNPAITAAQVASRLGMSERTARRYLTALRTSDDRPSAVTDADSGDDDKERVQVRINGHRPAGLVGVSA